MCGIVGVHAPGQEAAGLASLALFALQHRGQESAGVAVSDGEGVMVYKDLGMVAQVLDERRLPSLRGHLAIAHCRYSTTGSTLWENSQPSYRLGPRRAVAVGHNGNLVNTRQLLERLRGGKRRMSGTSDTELLTALLSDEPADDLVDALGRVLPGISGAFSLVVMDEQRVVGVRDPHGFRPLVLGRLPGEPEGWVLASETAALDILGADVVREVEPGEMVVLGEPGGPRSVRYAEGREHLCVFELIYFARPDSYMLGRSLYEARRRMGEELAREAPVDADLVVVDDSIVRGTTTKQIVALLRRAGATEVHLRISAPPIFHPCFYGIDTQVETELIAARMDLEGIRDYLGADSLAYLSIGGVLDALQLPRDRFCFACFDGVYPVPVPYDVASHKFVLEDDPVVASAVTVP